MGEDRGQDPPPRAQVRRRPRRSRPATPDQNDPLAGRPDLKICPFCAEAIPAAASKCRHCGEFLQKRPEGIGAFAKKHVTLLVSLGLSSLVVMKLLLASHYNTSTALTLLQEAGAARVIMGQLLSLLPMLLMGTAAVGFVYATGQARTTARKVAQIVSACILGVGVLLLPWSAAIYWGVLWVGLLIWVARRGADRFMRGTIAGIAVAFLIVLLIDDHVWLPPESLEVRTRDPIVGYVVGDQGGWTTILGEAHRQIIRVRSESLVSRRVCRLPLLIQRGWSWIDVSHPSPLELAFFSDDPRPPACPTTTSLPLFSAATARRGLR